MNDKLQDDLGNIEREIEKQYELSRKYEQQALKARNRAFWALNVAIVALVFQGFSGGWRYSIATLLATGFILICAESAMKRKVSFRFFQDFWRIFMQGWRSRLMPASNR